jgi:DNA-binding response OmpR family regulator
MPRVLCVDDDEALVQVISDMLSYSGFDTVTATSGEDCLRLLGERPLPDLVLLDIMMSPMDGWQTLSRIREDSELGIVPVIMLTGKYPTMSEVSIYGMLFEGYLMKPFAMKALIHTVDSILERVKAREEIIRMGMQIGMDQRTMCEFRRLFSIGEVLDQFEKIITDGSFDRESMHHLMDRLQDLLRTLGDHGIDVEAAMPV